MEIPAFRPPSEHASLLIRATRNCPWNRCTFCAMHKQGKFELRTVAEVKEDILAFKEQAQELTEWAWRNGLGERVGAVARSYGIWWLDSGKVTTAFIGDSNSLVMRTPDLVAVVRFFYECFPTLERVTSYARAHTILRKQPEELRQLREAGLQRLHVGLETGDNDLLREIQKGATAQEMIEAGRRALEAGFELSFYVMPGLGGRGAWEQHARGTARVLNAVSPHFIRLRTLGVNPETALGEKAQRGEFQTQDLPGLLEEVRLMLAELECTSYLVTSDFSRNFYLAGVEGHLPEDKERMLKALEAVRERVRERASPPGYGQRPSRGAEGRDLRSARRGISE